jgi:hypothetical protein
MIFVITPLQVDNNRWSDRSIPTTAEYADIIRALSSENNVNILDLWKDPNRVELNDLHDGLHLGVGGNKKVLEGLQNILRNTYPHLVPEDTPQGLPNLSLHFPHHSKLTMLADEKESGEIMDSWQW